MPPGLKGAIAALALATFTACTMSSAEKSRLIAYHDSGQYMKDIAAVDAEALQYLKERAPQVKKPAVVLDIDETSLSNWPELRANGIRFMAPGPCDRLPRGPCGLTAWQKMSAAKGIAPTVRLARAAQEAGVTVFFITGRHEALRAATAENLTRAGFRGWKELILRPGHSGTPSAADYKAPRRARIEEMGYTIIASIGDQQSDLSGGHAERTFKLPNPFYYLP